MSKIKANKVRDPISNGTIQLPASKSISNRLLVMRALSEQSVGIQNLSTARDTEVLQTLFKNSSARNSNSPHKWDVNDAGTAARFLAAYLSIQSVDDHILTGSERLKRRPIRPLMDALEKLGANIEYIENKGQLPIRISRFQQRSNEVLIPANISSQFISALLMIAPCLEGGLSINLNGKLISEPYVDMTLKLMSLCGVVSEKTVTGYFISNQRYTLPGDLKVEADWSAASYFYGLAAVLSEADYVFPNLSLGSIQGDRIVADIFLKWGVQSTETEEGVRIQKLEKKTPDFLKYDFTDCPDLVQTVAVCCAACGTHALFSGVQSLRVKETERVKALQTELLKIGVELKEVSNDVIEIIPIKPPFLSSKSIIFDTHNDHRMAMSLAMLSALYPVAIRNPEVVRKSFPGFWGELKQKKHHNQ